MMMMMMMMMHECFVKAFTADIDKNLIDFPPKVHSFMFLTQITTHTHHMLWGGKNMSLLLCYTSKSVVIVFLEKFELDLIFGNWNFLSVDLKEVSKSGER